VTHEGDGFNRGFSTLALAAMLGDKLKIPRDKVIRTLPIQGIAGTTGFMVPHAAVFVRRKVEGKEGKEKRLVVAGACTRALLPEEIGTMTHVREVRDTVKALMKDAQIDDPKDVHFIFVKGQTVSFISGTFLRDIRDAESRGKKLISDDGRLVGSYSRAAGALGVALALGEVKESELGDDRILKDRDKIYSLIAHCSSGNERPNAAIILLGNTTKSTSDLIIGHGVLEDGLDAVGVKKILKDMGFKFECCPAPRIWRE